jgi:hypothetical protein
MPVTICVRDTALKIPMATARDLAEELQAYAAGHRGDYPNPAAARALAEAISDRVAKRVRGPLTLANDETLDALHTALNAIVDEIGPAMKLYNAVDMARRAA